MYDASQERLTDHVPRGSADFATMLFFLSAIPSGLFEQAVRNVAEVSMNPTPLGSYAYLVASDTVTYCEF